MVNTTLNPILETIPEDQLPHHIAIVMDGNRRWAKRAKLPKIAGHKAGIRALRSVVEACGDYGIKVLTLFAFSRENWGRSGEEVNHLMALFLRTLKRETQRLHKHQIQLKILGDISAFSQSIQDSIQQAEQLTQHNHKVTLQIAANYSGRWDIMQATQKLMQQVQDGTLDVNQCQESHLDALLSTHAVAAPDLFIRTSGEQRISNFMLWQLAYSELYFTDVLWPDFGRDDLHRALLSYAERSRRFGH